MEGRLVVVMVVLYASVPTDPTTNKPKKREGKISEKGRVARTQTNPKRRKRGRKGGESHAPMTMGSLALKMCCGRILSTTGKTAVAMA